MRVGFVGLGAMGLPMTRHLLAAGHDVVELRHGDWLPRAPGVRRPASHDALRAAAGLGRFEAALTSQDIEAAVALFDDAHLFSDRANTFIESRGCRIANNTRHGGK